MAVIRSGQTRFNADQAEMIIGIGETGTPESGSLLVDASDANRVLTIQSADGSFNPTLGFGYNAGDSGTGLVTGAGTALSLKGTMLPGGPLLAIGMNGTGSLTIASEALLRIEAPVSTDSRNYYPPEPRLWIGAGKGSSGELIVDNAAAELVGDDAQLTVGKAGFGTASFRNGASVSLDASGRYATAQVLVGSSGGNGELSLRSGALLDIASSDEAELEVTSGSASVEDGGKIAVRARLERAKVSVGWGEGDGTANLTVDGPSSTLSISSELGDARLSSGIGEAAGSASITIQNGGTIEVAGDYASAYLGGSAELRILSGGKLRLEDLQGFSSQIAAIEIGVRDTLQAVVTVEGTGSLLDVGYGVVRIGGRSDYGPEDGNGVLTVRDGGEIRADYISVGLGGNLVVDDGILNASLSLSGGHVHLVSDVALRGVSLDGGTLQFDVSADGTSNSAIQVTEGAVFFDGVVAINPLDGHKFAAGDMLTLVTASNARSLNIWPGFAGANVSVAGQSADFGYALTAPGIRLQFRALNSGVDGGHAELDFGASSKAAATFTYDASIGSGYGEGGVFGEVVARNIDGIFGTAAADEFTVIGTVGYTLPGRGGSDTLTGGGGADTLLGGEGNDTLSGGGLGDTMRGEAGDDAYFVGESGDLVFEAAEAGLDIVSSSISFSLSALVNGSAQFADNLTLTGTAVSGTGNDLDNQIIGNRASNTLVGRIGNDTLTGDASGLVADADTLSGGWGNDLYYVDHAGDKVIEAGRSGTDTVISSVSFSLAASVNGAAQFAEHLTLTGTAAGAIGNNAANTITGNAAANKLEGDGGDDTLTGGDGNDTLDGGAYGDTMRGGRGDDTFLVNVAGDKVFEAGLSGIDTVESSIGFDLSALVDGAAQSLENLTLTGRAAKGTGNHVANALVGNTAANTLSGNGGADKLTGGQSKDTLSGGLGSDTFVFANGDSGITASTADLIVDWSTSDSIDVSTRGSGLNYLEAETTVTTIGGAASEAERSDTAHSDYVFLFNLTANTGYLLADLDNDESFETGITLAGAGAAGDFSRFDLI